MNCPNCNEKPVGLQQLFSLKGVTFKESFNGYFRCRHCGTLLKQSTGTGLYGKFRSGFWWWYSLLTLIVFGILLVAINLLEQWTGDLPWLLFTGIICILAAYMVLMHEIKSRYWIIEEADKELDKKTAARMGTLGWGVLLVFLTIMLGTLFYIDLFIDVSGIHSMAYLAGLVVYILGLTGGSVAIFRYFDISDSLQEHRSVEPGKVSSDE